MARKALLILSYRELHDRTATKLKKGGYDQSRSSKGARETSRGCSCPRRTCRRTVPFAQ
ncbi:MAG: hypothetical protein ACM3U2_02520 [Deltaproteobacteria bacterium]